MLFLFRSPNFPSYAPSGHFLIRPGVVQSQLRPLSGDEKSENFIVGIQGLLSEYQVQWPGYGVRQRNTTPSNDSGSVRGGRDGGHGEIGHEAWAGIDVARRDGDTNFDLFGKCVVLW